MQINPSTGTKYINKLYNNILIKFKKRSITFLCYALNQPRRGVYIFK